MRVFLLSCLTLAAGCRLASPANETAPVQVSQPAVDMTQIADTIQSTIQQQASQVTNDVWPWIFYLSLTGGLLIAACTFLVYIVVKRNSYLVQKPVYEAMKPVVFTPVSTEVKNGMVVEKKLTPPGDTVTYARRV